MSAEGAVDAAIARLVAAFEACTLPADQFRHRQHLQVAWWLLHVEPPLAAMARFVASLRRYAAHLGKPELYHETITWAYLLLVNERLERGGRGRSWAEFAHDHPELFGRALLERYWAPATLDSPFARRCFVFPDA